MKTDAYEVKIVFLTPVLGSQPSNPEIATEFIMKKSGMSARPEDEEQYLPDLIDKGTTIFYRKDDGPAVMNYQILGFLKEAGKVQNGKVAGGVKNLRSKVGSQIFVSPRIIPLNLPEGGEMDYLERPLRADTPRGQIVSLARSEMLPEGTWFKCSLEILSGELTEEVLRDLLDYGYYRGLGQWRNSGAFGTFRYELRKQEMEA
jgi:hypothetical protein